MNIKTKLNIAGIFYLAAGLLGLLKFYIMALILCPIGIGLLLGKDIFRRIAAAISLLGFLLGSLAALFVILATIVNIFKAPQYVTNQIIFLALFILPQIVIHYILWKFLKSDDLKNYMNRKPAGILP